MMNRLLYISFLIFFVFHVNAQLSISGTVRPIDSEKNLKEVDVYLIEKDQLQRGSFYFSGLEPSNYSIIFFAIGYHTQEINVVLERDTIIDIKLTPLENKLSEVVIQDQKDELFAIKRLRAVEGTAIYAGKKSEVIRLEKMMGNLAGNNSRQIYAQIAGLNIYEGNDGGLQLSIGGRGLDPNRTANFNTRQNGYDISADVLGYPESYYTPIAEALDEIQIIRGAASLQYGSQFGGLINFKTYKTPSNKKFEWISNLTGGSFGFMNTYNNIGVNVGKWQFQSYYNYKQGSGYRAHSEFNAHNYFGSAKYNFSENTSLKIEYTLFKYLAQQAGGLTDTQFKVNPRLSTRERNWFSVNWKLYNALFKHKFSSSSEMSLSFFALDAERFSLGFRGNPSNLNENPITAIDEQNIDGSYVLPRDLIKGYFNNFGLEARYLQRYKLKSHRAVWLIGSKFYKAKNQSIQGAGSTSQDANFNFQIDQFPDYANQSTFDFPNQNLAIFSENIFYVNDQLSITPGVRLEYIKTESDGTFNSLIFDNAGNVISNKTITDNQSLPRTFMLAGIGLSYQPKEYINAYANISQNYRSVTFSDIRTVNPSFIIDPEISDEKGFTTDVGLRGKFKKILSYDFGIYSIRYNDRIGIILDERANRVRKNIGNALIYGLESLIEVNITPTAKQFSLKWFNNLAITNSKYLSSEENNVVGKKVEFIPFINYKTGLNGGYQNLLASLQFSYISEQFTDVQNSKIPEDGDSRAGVIGPIPAYQVIDFSVSYQWKKFKLSSGITNVLNTPYFTRRATGYPGPGIIPSDGRGFYLTLGFKI